MQSSVGLGKLGEVKAELCKMEKSIVGNSKSTRTRSLGIK